MTPQERIFMWTELLQSDGWGEISSILKTKMGDAERILLNIKADQIISIANAQRQYLVAKEILTYPASQRDLARAEMDTQTETEVIDG